MSKNSDSSVRPARFNDLTAMRQITEATGLFPVEMLEPLLAPFFGDAPGALWLVCEAGGLVTGFAYADHEDLTNGTWNMRALAVHPDSHRTGLGRALVGGLEAALRAREQRIIVVDTSGREDFAGTRAFYRSIGYLEAARIPEFWDVGDDKVTFWKAL